MDTRPDLDTLLAAAAGKPQVFNFNYRMTGTELKGWTLVNTVVAHDRPDAVERLYIWEKDGSRGRTLVRIGMAEMKDGRDAVLVLHDTLQHSMRPDVTAAPRALARGTDVAFSAQAPGSATVAAVDLTLGNLAVTVTSVGDTEVDVSPVVAQLRRTLAEPPPGTKAAGGAARKATRSAPTEAAAAAPADDGRTVVEQLPEAGEGVWVKVLAPAGTRLAREGRRLVCEPGPAAESTAAAAKKTTARATRSTKAQPKGAPREAPASPASDGQVRTFVTKL